MKFKIHYERQDVLVIARATLIPCIISLVDTSCDAMYLYMCFASVIEIRFTFGRCKEQLCILNLRVFSRKKIKQYSLLSEGTIRK